MKIELNISDELLRSVLCDFFPPFTEQDRLDYNYDSGTVWTAFDLANAVVEQLPREEKARLLGEDAIAYREQRIREKESKS